MPINGQTIPQSTTIKFLVAAFLVAVAFAFETGAFSGL
jgi:hypothetical protein